MMSRSPNETPPAKINPLIEPPVTHLLTVALLTLVWCLFHSLLITRAVQGWLERGWRGWHGFGRIIYILGSALSFALLYWYFQSLPARYIWTWPGAWTIVRIAGSLTGLLLMLLGTRVYDQAYFFGFRQASIYLRGEGAAETVFRRHGILALIRHPYYSGGILILAFGSNYSDVNLIWRSLLIAYLIVGSELEERRLATELGERYRRYRQEVPRFLPRLPLDRARDSKGESGCDSGRDRGRDA